MIRFSASASIILDSEDDDGDSSPQHSLETHFWVPERSPAPFSESFHEEEINEDGAIQDSTEEITVAENQISSTPWVRIKNNSYLFRNI